MEADTVSTLHVTFPEHACRLPPLTFSVPWLCPSCMCHGLAGASRPPPTHALRRVCPCIAPGLGFLNEAPRALAGRGPGQGRVAVPTHSLGPTSLWSLPTHSPSTRWDTLTANYCPPPLSLWTPWLSSPRSPGTGKTGSSRLGLQGGPRPRAPGKRKARVSKGSALGQGWGQCLGSGVSSLVGPAV